MLPKIFYTIFFILFASLKTSNGETCQPWKDNCTVDKYKCKVNCVEGNNPSTCANEVFAGGVVADDCPDDSDVSAIAAIEEMNGGKCKELCKIDKNCYYYRYEELSHQTPKTKNCYLMSKEQCGDFADGDCDNPTFCESGVGSDNQCDGGENGIVDEIYTCKGKTVHEAGMIPNYKLHWNCIGSGKEVDIENDEIIPGGTICTAKPVCEKDLKYECVPKDNSQGQTEGKWKYAGKSIPEPNPSMVEVSDAGKLIDPFCNAESLVVTNYEDQITMGMEIVCVETPPVVDSGSGSGTIEAQNSCILFCDGYTILNFYTVAQSWEWQLMDGSGSPETIDPSKVDDVIYCHK